MLQKSQKIYDGTYLFPGADNCEENRENSIFVSLALKIFKFPPKWAPYTVPSKVAQVRSQKKITGLFGNFSQMADPILKKN